MTDNQVKSSMFDVKSFIHMVKNYVILVWEIEDPGMLSIVIFSTQVAME